MPELELEPEDHRYLLRGVEIPGVTSVLTAVGAAPSFWFLTKEELDYYRSRGQAVHKMIELYIKGTLDKRTIPKDIKPYLIGWERFVNDYNVEVIQTPLLASGPQRPFTEIPLHHEVYRYGVTPDVVANVKGHIAPIELKATSAHSAATEIQTAAQQLAVEHGLGIGLHGMSRWACRLLPEEPYFDPKMYTERGDRSTWIGMLSTYNWRNKHKLIRSER